MLKLRISPSLSNSVFSRVLRIRRHWRQCYGTVFTTFRYNCRVTTYCSGAGKNLKVGGGGTRPEQSAGKCFFGRAPPFFGFKNTISLFGDRFCDGQYSLVSFLFAVLLITVPSVPSHL